MKNKIIWIFLIVIVVLAAVLRLWQLGNVPPSLDWDEAALGYDAYSILHTGNDQYGKFMPVVLRSIGDYKPGLYAYLAIPSIATLGLNAFAVRLPSAIFGILSVLAVFFLVRELFGNHKSRDRLALLSSFILAISPWSIQFSRVAFESNIGTTLNIFAALFFLKGLKKPWILLLSAVFAALSVYAYQSEKVFTPLLILALVLVYRKQLFVLGKRYLLTAFVIGAIFVLPMLFYIATDKSSLIRVQGTSVFASQTELLKADLRKINRDELNHDQLGLILDNRRIVYAKTIVQGYLAHFDLNWMFITGDIARHHAHDMGLLYLFELPLLLLGAYMFLFGEYDRKTKLILFSWILIAPIPASLTTGVPSAVRTLNFLPILQIVIAVGLLSVFNFIRTGNLLAKAGNLRKKIYILIIVVFFGFAVFNIAYYLDQYFVQDNYYDSAYWQYGYKQAVEEVNTISNRYKAVVVSDKEPLDQSYIFFLFYLKYPPKEYQTTGAYASHHSFAKFTFRAINWQKDSQVKNTLYVGAPGEIPIKANIIKTIYNLDGTAAIQIAGT